MSLFGVNTLGTNMLISEWIKSTDSAPQQAEYLFCVLAIWQYASDNINNSLLTYFILKNGFN